MIVDQRYVDYINSLEKELPPYLEELEQYALQTEVPIIRKEMQSFLKTLLKMNKPKQILEVGTAIGFSALLMKEFMPADGQITTIEKYEKRIPVARANFEAHGDGRITLLEGDAMEILAGLTGSYDMIFMDAAKGQYINFLPEVLRVMKTSAVLISDNVLQEGSIAESRYAVTRRDRTIHARMREYMYELTHMNELITSIVPIGDGITMSVKRMEDNNA